MLKERRLALAGRFQRLCQLRAVGPLSRLHLDKGRRNSPAVLASERLDRDPLGLRVARKVKEIERKVT